MAVETLRPNEAGDATNIPNQEPPSGEHWQKVDEASSDEDGTFIYRTGPWGDDYDLYNLPASSESGTINFIKVYVRARELGAGDTFRIKIKTGGTEYDNGKDLYLEAKYVNYSHQWNTNPKVGGAWTWAQIDALQIGVLLFNSEDVEVRCTQVYVEVDYTLPAVGRSFGFIIG